MRLLFVLRLFVLHGELRIRTSQLFTRPLVIFSPHLSKGDCPLPVPGTKILPGFNVACPSTITCAHIVSWLGMGLVKNHGFYTRTRQLECRHPLLTNAILLFCNFAMMHCEKSFSCLSEMFSPLGLSFKWPPFIETLLKAQPNAQRVAIYINVFQHISIRCVKAARYVNSTRENSKTSPNVSTRFNTLCT